CAGFAGPGCGARGPGLTMSGPPGSFFPEGVFGSDGDDHFDLWIRRGRGQVILDFHSKVSYVGMSAFQARQIAHVLVSYAEILEREAGDHLGAVREEKPAEPKSAPEEESEPKSG